MRGVRHPVELDEEVRLVRIGAHRGQVDELPVEGDAVRLPVVREAVAVSVGREVLDVDAEGDLGTLATFESPGLGGLAAGRVGRPDRQVHHAGDAADRHADGELTGAVRGADVGVVVVETQAAVRVVDVDGDRHDGPGDVGTRPGIERPVDGTRVVVVRDLRADLLGAAVHVHDGVEVGVTTADAQGRVEAVDDVDRVDRQADVHGARWRGPDGRRWPRHGEGAPGEEQGDRHRERPERPVMADAARRGRVHGSSSLVGERLRGWRKGHPRHAGGAPVRAASRAGAARSRGRQSHVDADRSPGRREDIAAPAGGRTVGVALAPAGGTCQGMWSPVPSDGPVAPLR